MKIMDKKDKMRDAYSINSDWAYSGAIVLHITKISYTSVSIYCRDDLHTRCMADVFHACISAGKTLFL